jgi:hypothetical protein
VIQLHGSMSRIRHRIANELQSACLFSEAPDQTSAVIQCDQLCSDMNDVASDSDIHSKASDSDSETENSVSKCSYYRESTSQVPYTVHSSSDSELEDSYLPMSWCKLRSELQSVLPPTTVTCMSSRIFKP